jgi:hypothetical protein
LLPDDVRAFYRATNGLRVPGTVEVDNAQFDFWRLHEVERSLPDSTQFYFADVLQSSWTLAVDLGPPGSPDTGAVYVAAGPSFKIADSFGEFMDLYVADDPLIYPISWDKPPGSPQN